MKKIKLENGTLISSQKEILSHVRLFYSDLFSCKDDEQHELDWKNGFSPKKKLSRSEAGNLDGPITIRELSNVLKI